MLDGTQDEPPCPHCCIVRRPPIFLMGRAAPSLVHQYSSWEGCPIPCPPIFLMGRAAPSLVNDQNRFRLYQQFWQLLNDLGLWDHPTYLMRKEVVTHIDDRQETMPLCVKHVSITFLRCTEKLCHFGDHKVIPQSCGYSIYMYRLQIIF